MEVVILWAGINGIIGYAIGSSKNKIGECMALCIMLGPIGWLISLFVSAPKAAAPAAPNRVCPFCAENIKPQAIVCPHCRRDLVPDAPPPRALPAEPIKPKIPINPNVPDPADVERVRELVHRYENQPPNPNEPYRI